MRTRLSIATLALALVLAGAWLIPAFSPALASPAATEGTMEDDMSKRTISVSGSGRVSASPDIAVVTLGVETQADEATTAFTENGQQMQALMDALKEAKVVSEDMQTQAVRLYPRYEDKQDNAGQNVLAGYTASNIVQVYVRDLETIGGVLDAAVQAGGNRIQGIRFEISEYAAYLDQAREAAWRDAMHKAQQLANLSGSELGRVITINESSHDPQPIIERAMLADSAGSTPIEAGRQIVEVNVKVTWSISEEE